MAKCETCQGPLDWNIAFFKAVKYKFHSDYKDLSADQKKEAKETIAQPMFLPCPKCQPPAAEPDEDIEHPFGGDKDIEQANQAEVVPAVETFAELITALVTSVKDLKRQYGELQAQLSKHITTRGAHK